MSQLAPHVLIIALIGLFWLLRCLGRRAARKTRERLLAENRAQALTKLQVAAAQWSVRQASEHPQLPVPRRDAHPVLDTHGQLAPANSSTTVAYEMKVSRYDMLMAEKD